jgi:hypothetical protein
VDAGRDVAAQEDPAVLENTAFDIRLNFRARPAFSSSTSRVAM